MDYEHEAHVLVADDDPSIRQLLCTVVRRERLDVDCVADGQEAIDRLREHDYSVILLDLMMPRVDGAEFLRQLASLDLSTRSRPVVLLMTAFSNDRLPVIGEPIHAVVKKPFDIEDLVALVSGCVEQRKAHEAIKRER